MREQQQQSAETVAGATLTGRHINKGREEALFISGKETPNYRMHMMDVHGYK